MTNIFRATIGFLILIRVWFLKIALKSKPKFVCLVPEKRNENTTEGGLNLKKDLKKIKIIVNKLNRLH